MWKLVICWTLVIYTKVQAQLYDDRIHFQENVPVYAVQQQQQQQQAVTPLRPPQPSSGGNYFPPDQSQQTVARPLRPPSSSPPLQSTQLPQSQPPPPPSSQNFAAAQYPTEVPSVNRVESQQDGSDAVNQFYPPVETIQNPYVDAISKGNARFALTFFKNVNEAIPQHDFMVSPFSVWALLASAAEGAGGNTLEEFKNILNLRDITQLGSVFDQIRSKLVVKTPTVDLTVFQAIFHNKSLAIGEEYKRKIQTQYHTELYPLEGAKLGDQIKTVNGIIREATNGFHQAAFQASDLAVTSMLLLSLIHFRGQWRFPFNKTYTRTEPFHDEYGVPTGQVEMMFQRTFIPYAPVQKLESHVIDLPYGDTNRLRMLVILPRKNIPLQQVFAKLETITIGEIFDDLKRSVQQFDEEEIEVHLPKFNTSSNFLLNAILEKMGMSEVFSTAADFKKINPNIYLTRITHKSKIMVDEEGTVASSISAGLFANKSSGPRFYANRPFLYLIVDRVTKLVLFCGQMRNNPYTTQSRDQ